MEAKPISHSSASASAGRESQKVPGMQCKIQRKSWYLNPSIWNPCSDVLIPAWTVGFSVRIWYARSRLTEGARSPCAHPSVGTVCASPQGSAGALLQPSSTSQPAALACRSLHCECVLLTWGMDASSRDSASCELEVVLIFTSSHQMPLLSLLKLLWKAEVDTWC